MSTSATSRTTFGLSTIRRSAALEKCFVLIIDDWNWVGPRLGTYRAIRDAGRSIVCSIEVRTTTDNSHPVEAHGNSDWHNGYFFGVLAKPA